MEEKLGEIQLLKTTMMIIIVLYHSCIFFGGEWFACLKIVYEADYLNYLVKWFSTFHIQAFSMASGFLFYYLKKEKNKYNNIKKDIKKRSKRLLIPYVFTCILWVIPIGNYFFKYSIKDIFVNYFLMVSPSQLWFLPMIFLVFCFFEIFSDKIKINFKGLIICYCLTTIIGYVLQFFEINYFQISTAIRYILYFYLGGVLYSCKDKINLKQICICIGGIIILLPYLIVMKDTSDKLLKYFNILITPVLSLCEVSLIYVVCDVLVNKKKIKLNGKLYKLLEENSFGIYLFHQQIIYFCIILLNGIVHPIIQCLISFIVATSTSLLMSVIFKKHKSTRFMFGL